jgi:inner membrane transporter RhtA
MRRLHHLIWPLLAALGVGLLVRDSHGWTVDLIGAGLAVLAAGGWASYILASKRVGRLFRGHDGLAMSFIFATLISLPFGIGELRGAMSFAAILQMAGLAILVPLLPFALEMSALRRMKTRSFGVLMSAEPAIGALVGLVVLGEHLLWLQWIGIACVVAASIGAVVEGGDAAH